MTTEIPEASLAETTTADVLLDLNIAEDDSRWDLADWQPGDVTIRPRRMKIFLNCADGQWHVGAVVVGGPRVRKNRTMTVKDQLVRYPYPFDEDTVPQMPDWVEFLVRREFARFQDSPVPAVAPDSLEARVARLESLAGVAPQPAPVEEREAVPKAATLTWVAGMSGPKETGFIGGHPVAEVISLDGTWYPDFYGLPLPGELGERQQTPRRTAASAKRSAQRIFDDYVKFLVTGEISMPDTKKETGNG